MNGATFTRQQLQTVVQMIADAPDIEARSQIPGIDSTRADIILAGAIILEEFAVSLDISEFTYCDFALREGLLFNEIQRLSPGGVDDIRHVALASATKLAMRCDDDFSHAQSVARLACTLFDQLSKHFEMDQNDRLYLETASLLANVGITVSHAKHHLHSQQHPHVLRKPLIIAGFTLNPANALFANQRSKSITINASKISLAVCSEIKMESASNVALALL
jgi:exopolyphosphatase/guanosine-5'-triphosphate,3'-diphosphate pyrophosphatase